MTYRIIVTGSRKYEWRHRVRAHLDAMLALHPDLEVVHGGCLTGADEQTNEWAIERGVPLDVFMASWFSEGPSAGPIRNSGMVKSGADQCVGFWLPTGDRKENRGTRDCCTKADKIGIPVLCAWGDEAPSTWHSKKYGNEFIKGDVIPHRKQR